MKKLQVVFALTLAVGALQAKEPIAWESAQVISQEMSASPGGVFAAPIGTAAIAVPIVNRSNVVELETARYRLRLVENTGGRGPIVLPVNGTIQFYRDDKWIIILDFKKHKHRFGLVNMVQK